MITCTKILEYELYQVSKTENVFKRVCKILNQKIDPLSLKPGELRPKEKTIFLSPLKRCKQCVSVVKGKRYLVRKELAEIPFTLEKLVDEKEYSLQKSTAVRKAFIEMFLKDQLLISRKKIFSQIKSLLSEVKENPGSVRIVSHSFRLKLLQAYVNTRGKIEHQPKLIHEYIKPTEKIFGFGETFLIRERDLDFTGFKINRAPN